MRIEFDERHTEGGLEMFANNRSIASVAAGLVTALIAVLLESGFASAWAAQLVSAS